MFLLPVAIALALAAPVGSLTDDGVHPSGGQAPILDVPYLPQTEALCGGAAVAMVLRYWGDRHAMVAEFRSLVDWRAGGIADDVLVTAVRNRGWIAVQLSASLETLRDRLRAGQPPILLIEDRPGRYHFVVAVGIEDRDIVLHDPTRGPLRRLPIPEFLNRWQASQYWALVVLPDPMRSVVVADATTLGAAVPPSDSICASMRAGAVEEVRARGTGVATDAFSHVRATCPDDSRVIGELAGVKFAEKQWAEAAALAERATALDPSDAYAWDVLGSSRFLETREHRALDAWNRIGRPQLDRVQIEGLTHTRYALVSDALALEPGSLLTRSDYELAARRLDQLPTRASARIDYRPDAEGFAVVDVDVVERSILPGGWMGWAILGARSATTREIDMTVPGPTGQGEAWTVGWRWWTNRPRVSLGLAVPRAGAWPGVWRVDAFKESQTYRSTTETAVLRETQTHVGLSVANWVTSSTRYEASASLDAWNGGRRAVSIGGTLEKRFVEDKVAARGSARFWVPLAGGSAFQLFNAQASVRSSTEHAGWVHQAIGGIDVATVAAPLAIWSGAGDGHGRARLLRAHPLLQDGVIAGPMFGRRVGYGSVETTRWLRRPTLPALAVAGFADLAAASGALSSGTRVHVDVGVGLRMRLPGHDGVLRLDYGRGLRDGVDAVAVGWEF